VRIAARDLAMSRSAKYGSTATNAGHSPGRDIADYASRAERHSHRPEKQQSAVQYAARKNGGTETMSVNACDAASDSKAEATTRGFAQFSAPKAGACTPLQMDTCGGLSPPSDGRHAPNVGPCLCGEKYESDAMPAPRKGRDVCGRQSECARAVVDVEDHG
jgi:hypothetical protein